MSNDSLINRMVRAARLDKAFYNEVEADTSLNTQALMVVIIGAVAAGLSSLIGGIFDGFGQALIDLVVSVVLVILGYYIWAYVTYFVGTRFFGGQAEPGELLRTLGFAYAPQVLNVLGFIPCIGWLISVAVAIWTLVAGFIAVREALDIDTGKTLITVIVGWLIIFIVTMILATIFGVGAFAVSALTS